MGDVIDGRFITSLPLSPDKMMERASEYGLQEVVIVGVDKDGDLFFASSMPGSAEVLYWLEKAKHELFKTEDRIEATGDPRGNPHTGA